MSAPKTCQAWNSTGGSPVGCETVPAYRVHARARYQPGDQTIEYPSLVVCGSCARALEDCGTLVRAVRL